MSVLNCHDPKAEYVSYSNKQTVVLQHEKKFETNCLRPNGAANFESYLTSAWKFFHRWRVQKSPGSDNIHVNVIRNLYKKLKTSQMNIFYLSLITAIE